MYKLMVFHFNTIPYASLSRRSITHSPPYSVSIRVDAWSLFAATAGPDDDFAFAQTAQRRMNINEHIIPLFDGATRETQGRRRGHGDDSSRGAPSR
ncbi:hypothetical protein K503DRAFT_774182 [Rhizopogon vinicolor AM-OR11-026]|uniref:Uncharacterized protein n=1 Tax=Rhizopogon vinicolor AM-OR11-026 TaxID=1314800 RepID=A0A1B7MQ98_9AGAM|nr:hypothetical protein K503DRAFT_774182 [Rhizopogon vinicolor AM-OR11-026]